jgi:hypothetical protein
MENGIQVGRFFYTLDELAKLFTGRLRNAVVFFGSCSTVDINKNALRRFLKDTGTLAVCGYKSDVDWLRSTAFELLLLATIQGGTFSRTGIATIAKNVRVTAAGFRELEFRMVTRYEKSQSQPRT